MHVNKDNASLKYKINMAFMFTVTAFYYKQMVHLDLRPQL